MKIDKYEGLIFDLDGVLWLGNTPIEGGPQIVNTLREKEKQIRFLTNNASKHRTRVQKKLEKMGYQAGIDEIVTSGHATAQYLAKEHGPSRVHVMGAEDLKNEMRECGHTVVERSAEFVSSWI